jgi:hypothetical protein
MSGQKKLVFTAPAAIQSVKTLVDGTVKLDVAVAKELPANEMAILFEARKMGVGHFMFSPNDLDEDDLPAEKAETSLEGKSPSQRLHNVMFVCWKELTNQQTPFDIWRMQEMEKLINGYKSKLPERQ